MLSDGGYAVGWHRALNYLVRSYAISVSEAPYIGALLYSGLAIRYFDTGRLALCDLFLSSDSLAWTSGRSCAG